MDYAKHADGRKPTPQTKKVKGVDHQKRNNAGGVSFRLSNWDFLMRFLILGTEGGTYYVGEKKLTKQALTNVEKCIVEDGKRVVDAIVDVSDNGRSADNDAAIFALAMCASAKDLEVRKYALEKMPKVCRIGTHLFHFVGAIKTMRGFGQNLCTTLANWYTQKPVDKLAFQLMKYQSRDGWSHRDVIRLAHPVPQDDNQVGLFQYVTGKAETLPDASPLCVGINKLKGVKAAGEVAKLIREYKLPREVVPTEALNDVAVWEALLEHMPVTATIRNLGKMSSIGMLHRLSGHTKLIVDRITDQENIVRGRVHPLKIVEALLVYNQGHGHKGSLKWETNSRISDALNDAFYLAFKAVEPSNKRIMLALDVSGSMDGYKISGSQLMSCRVASAVMAMVTARNEPEHMAVAFTAHGGKVMRSGVLRGTRGEISEVNLSPKANLEAMMGYLKKFPFSGTDCALPMLYAMENNLKVDTFVIYTDSETWAGSIHPFQALEQYRQRFGIPAKLVVVGMVGNKFSIANPEDPGMLDVVGFDTNAPAAISEFAKM